MKAAKRNITSNATSGFSTRSPRLPVVFAANDDTYYVGADSKSALIIDFTSGQVWNLPLQKNTSGMRIEKIGERGTERYTYDDKAVLQQFGSDNQTIAKYEYGATKLISLKHNTEPTQFYFTDALNSVVNLTNSSGAVQARYQYDAWGLKRNETGSSWNRFAFTGYEEDKETNLLYAKARYYDPEVPRFLSQDAWEGQNDLPPSLHKYLYAYQNPTVWVDPTGNYNEAGHFYTTYYIAREIGYSHEQAHELAFYSQLPDEVGSYDAVPAGFEYVANKIGLSKKSDAAVQERIDVVQEGMHALTGGSAIEEGSTARAHIVGSADNKKAGIAIHKLADTYAHRVPGSDDRTENARLFDPGIGHALHGEAPDQIHRRKELYQDYATDLANTLAERMYGSNLEARKAAVEKAQSATKDYLKIVVESEKLGVKVVQNHKGIPHAEPDDSAISDRTSREFKKYTEARYSETNGGRAMADPLSHDIPMTKTGSTDADIQDYLNTIPEKSGVGYIKKSPEYVDEVKDAASNYSNDNEDEDEN